MPTDDKDSLPEEVVAEAREWERHVVEVETGLPPDAGPGCMPRPEYDPARCSLAQRKQAKAAELGVSPFEQRGTAGLCR